MTGKDQHAAGIVETRRLSTLRGGLSPAQTPLIAEWATLGESQAILLHVLPFPLRPLPCAVKQHLISAERGRGTVAKRDWHALAVW